MMQTEENLQQASCEACSADAPRLSGEELAALKPTIPNWQVVEVDGVSQLLQVFKFDNFAKALAFANRVGELAESEGHHPALLVEWGKVTVRWWSHKLGGLHKNDVIMAVKTDKI